MDTQFSSGWKRNSQALEDSGCILYFTCKLLISKSYFLLIFDYSGIDFGLQISPKKNIERSEVRWTCRPGNGSFTSARHLAARAFFRQPFTNFRTVMWYNTVTLKPYGKYVLKVPTFRKYLRSPSSTLKIKAAGSFGTSVGTFLSDHTTSQPGRHYIIFIFPVVRTSNPTLKFYYHLKSLPYK